MPFMTLSEQVKTLPDPQRSDMFVKRFREAVRTGELEAGQLPTRFTLPKAYRKRGSDETGTWDARDMVFERTPEYEAWFEAVSANLAEAPTRGRKVQLTLENVESGAVDFKALAAQTRGKIQASFEKGQRLGKSRPGAKTKGKAARGRTVKARK